jgi:hypothetical protein
MPDDPVFEGKPNGGAETPKETPPQPASGISEEKIASIVSEQVGPIQKSVEQFNQFLTKLQEQSQQANEPAAPVDETDWATKFYNQPQETVQTEVASQTSPVIQQAATTMGTMLMDQQKAAIDSEFGEGSWDEVFKTRLDPVVADAAKNNPMSLMSPTAIQNAVNTIKGDNFAALAKRAMERAEAAQSGPDKDLVNAVAEQVGSQFQMTGGLRRVKGDGVEKLDDADSTDFLKKFFENTGETINPERLAKVMNTGNTYDEWKAATKEKE